MARRDHTLARKLISDALDRFAAPEHEAHEGDAQLIVLGALLEAIEDRPREFIVMSISRRALAPIGAMIAAGVSAVVAYLKQWGFG